MSLTRVLLISNEGQFKLCSISVTELVNFVISVGYISSCSSLNFFNLIFWVLVWGSHTAEAYSNFGLTNLCFICMRFYS